MSVGPRDQLPEKSRRERFIRSRRNIVALGEIFWRLATFAAKFDDCAIVLVVREYPKKERHP